MFKRGSVNVPIEAEDKTGRAFKSAKNNMRMLGNEGAKVSRSLRLIGVGAGVGIAASAALATKSIITSAAEFERAAREVNSLLNLDENGFKELTKDIQEASVLMGTDLIDTTRAAYQAISAGVPRENLLEFLKTSSTAAIAGLSSTETAVDVLSTVVNSFGSDTISAERAADILFAAVKDGKTTFDQLASSLSKAAPLAAAMGIDFEELAAAAAAITKRGAPTAEAMTQIRAIMVALKKPTADMKLLFKQLGVTNGDALIQTYGLSGALQQVVTSAQSGGIEITKFFSETEALNGVLNLTGKNAEGFGASLANAYNSAGSAALAFDQNNGTALRAVEKLKSSWQNFGAQLMRTDEWGIAIGFLTEQIENLSWALNDGSATVGLAFDSPKLQSILGEIEQLQDILQQGIIGDESQAAIEAQIKFLKNAAKEEIAIIKGVKEAKRDAERKISPTPAGATEGKSSDEVMAIIGDTPTPAAAQSLGLGEILKPGFNPADALPQKPLSDWDRMAQERENRLVANGTGFSKYHEFLDPTNAAKAASGSSPDASAAEAVKASAKQGASALDEIAAGISELVQGLETVKQQVASAR